MPQPQFVFPREVLLVEIDRYCSFAECGARNRIGLTKPEAIEYRGFHCAICERWNDDSVDPETLPESWKDELLMARAGTEGEPS